MRRLRLQHPRRRAELRDVPVSPRRTCLAALVALGLLGTPAIAGVVDETVANLVPATAVGPRPIALLSATQPQARSVTPEQGAALQRRVEAALAGSTAGVVSAAVDVDGYGELVRRGAGQPLAPASTQKSYVALAALLALGPDARYRTEVAATAIPVNGRLPGSVWLVAGGDPYLDKGYLRLLARSVRQRGITAIAGDVLLDDMRYDQRRSVAGWKSSYMPGESGPLSALAVDRNRWRTDSTFLADPAIPAAVLFRDYLRAEGVTVAGGVRRGYRPATARTVAVNNGTLVTTAVRRVLKDSDNFAAELLLKEVGRVVRGQGTSAGGVTAVRSVLEQHGVPLGTSTDGSGLSTQDRQTTSGQLLLLQAADASGTGPGLRTALPLGCRDGTLKRRFCGTAAEGRVWAKTGTLAGVRTLSGYTETASGRTVWFSFQLTGVSDGARALAAVDRAVVALASSTD
ncbi:MAG: hypothetical protein JWM62_622 [Frankiales bacterium]|nr:hypothetical protein [Frankiales bacterium]